MYVIKEYLIGVFIYSIIFVISMWFIGLNNYERSLFLIPLKKIIDKMKG